MNSDLISTQINGVGILAILVIAYGALRRSSMSYLRQATVFGVATAAAAIFATAHPTVIGEGVLVDNRAIIVGLGAAFGGPLAALIAGTATGGFRLYLGGAGTVAGLLALCVSIAAGLGWRSFVSRKNRKQVSDLMMLGLGIAFHAGLVLIVPLPAEAQALAMTGMMTSSILSTLLLGSLMLREESLIRNEAKLANMATFDTLTKIANRRAFDRALHKISASKQDRPFAVLILDIDHFKSVNDRYGHAAGDVVLQAVASKLQTVVGDDATVARYGGEEFVVLLQHASPEDANRVAETIRARIADWTEAGDAGAIAVTVSIGVASAMPGTDSKLVLERADEALYRAKNSGRNCVRSSDAREAIETNRREENDPVPYALAS